MNNYRNSIFCTEKFSFTLKYWFFESIDIDMISKNYWLDINKVQIFKSKRYHQIRKKLKASTYDIIGWRTASKVVSTEG